MTLSKTIAKAKKLTGSEPVTNGQIWYFAFGKYTLSFCANGRADDDLDATCFYTTSKPRTEDDVNSDYWPGTFHDNLTQAFKFINR